MSEQLLSAVRGAGQPALKSVLSEPPIRVSDVQVTSRLRDEH